MNHTTEGAWRRQAACRPDSGIHPDTFFPELGDKALRREAERICAECPVIGECADYARQYGPFFGVWGGKFQSLTAARNNYHSPLGYVTANYKDTP